MNHVNTGYKRIQKGCSKILERTARVWYDKMCQESYQNYGAPKITKCLQAEGEIIAEKNS